MKFGQRIRREEVACLQGPLMELSDHFLRYKAMKKLITRISQVCPLPRVSGQREQWGAPLRAQERGHGVEKRGAARHRLQCVCVPGRFTGRVCGKRGRPLTFSLLC